MYKIYYIHSMIENYIDLFRYCEYLNQDDNYFILKSSKYIYRIYDAIERYYNLNANANAKSYEPTVKSSEAINTRETPINSRKVINTREMNADAKGSNTKVNESININTREMNADAKGSNTKVNESININTREMNSKSVFLLNITRKKKLFGDIREYIKKDTNKRTLNAELKEKFDKLILNNNESTNKNLIFLNNVLTDILQVDISLMGYT